MRRISVDLPLGSKEIILPCDFFQCGAKRGLTAPRVLWDTGAYPTILSTRLVKALGLMPTDSGFINSSEREGESVPYYHCDIRLPNGYRIHNVKVSEQPLPAVDALLGFDILSMGDFRLQHLTDRIRFTFDF